MPTNKTIHAMHNASAAGFWENCALYYHFKVDAEDAGEEWNVSGEAAKRGTIQHAIAEQAMIAWYAKKYSTIEACVSWSIKKVRKKVTAAEEREVVTAVVAAYALLERGEAMLVDFEVAIPLSHEPESFGTVDVGGRCATFLLVVDYKFGQIAVAANSLQNRIYGANFIQWLEGQGYDYPDDFPVKLAIVQPKLHDEAVVHNTTVGELRKFQDYINVVVENQKSGDRRGAGSLATCTYCPWEDRCHHRVGLVRNMMPDLSHKEAMPNSLVEEIVRNRGAYKRVIEGCVTQLIDNPETFPNWRRVQVSNGQKWSPLLDVLKKLKGKRAKNITVIRSPNQILADNPKLESLIDSLTVGGGYHVRLFEGNPADHPTKKAKAKGRKPNKKSASKAVKKKGSKRT